MRGRIEEKLRLDGARFDSLTLKPNLENMLRLRLRALRDQLGYKLPALLLSRSAQPAGGPSLPEILLGDDAEADAFVYSLYADICAGLVPQDTLARVLQLGRAYEDNAEEALRLARILPERPCVQRILIHLDRQLPPSRFAPYGPRVVPFYNYLQAALILAEDGLLPPGGVVRVAAEMVLDHRFDADGLARSYLELRRRGSARGDLLPALREAIDQLAQGARFPAQDELLAMCTLLSAQLPGVTPGTPPKDAPRDYLTLVATHNPRRKRGLGEQFLEPRQQRRRRQRADLPLHRLAPGEAHQQRDRARVVAGGPLRVIVDVELGDEQAPLELPGRVLQRRADHPAGAAPGGPEVDDHRHRRLGQEPLQLLVGDLDGLIRGREGCFARTTAASLVQTTHRDPVGLTTLMTTEHKRMGHEG
jgi:hypothetical protein